MERLVLDQEQLALASTQLIEAQKGLAKPMVNRSQVINPMKEIALNFPAIPVRGLWNQASAQEQVLAKQIAMTIIESWVGIKTKSEAAKSLGVRPVRFWQMNNQAMAGMMSGCLTQPRVRKKRSAEMAKQSELDQILELQKRIRVLTKKVENQEFLIEVMRTMPGMRGVGVKDDIAPISSRLQTKNRVRIKKKAMDERSGVSGSAECDGANTAELEGSVKEG